MLLPEEKFDGEIGVEQQSDGWRAYPQTPCLVIPRNMGLFARFREDTPTGQGCFFREFGPVPRRSPLLLIIVHLRDIPGCPIIMRPASIILLWEVGWEEKFS